MSLSQELTALENANVPLVFSIPERQEQYRYLVWYGTEIK